MDKKSDLDGRKKTEKRIKIDNVYIVELNASK